VKIVVLWSKPSGYLISQLKALHLLGVQVHLFIHSSDEDAPFFLQSELSFLSSHMFIDKIDRKSILREVNFISPNMILICSWNNLSYLNIARKTNAVKILFMDNQWRGTLKQFIGICLRRFIISPHFDGVLLPGQKQEEFARYLGFTSAQIGRMGYSADIDIFLPANPSQINKTFLYVGRLVEEKGISVLLDAYEGYKKSRQDSWKLRIVGNGILKKKILERGIPGVHVEDFVQPARLPNLYESSSCFILPSLFEPWGLVLHEAAASGLPIISSDVCGASEKFVESDINGFTFRSGDVLELEKAMLRLHDMSTSEWNFMSKSSKTKAQSVTPKAWATSLMGLFERIQKSREVR
jgi:glycosyltransferase involved in cell wall biosynthesis